jgi:hypothetical protein
MDAKHVAGKQMLVALGVTADGQKISLSFEETSTEHHEPVKSLLRELIDRGLSYDQRLLFVTDGARGLHKGYPGDRWGARTHSALPVAQTREYRRIPPQKRPKKVASEAAACLPEADLRGGEGSPHRDLHAQLQKINRSAARSLQEGPSRKVSKRRSRSIALESSSKWAGRSKAPTRSRT